MGRIEKQKRLIIEQSNKRILGESNIDMHLKNMPTYFMIICLINHNQT
jgi:hypothetical protein